MFLLLRTKDKETILVAAEVVINVGSIVYSVNVLFVSNTSVRCHFIGVVLFIPHDRIVRIGRICM